MTAPLVDLFPNAQKRRWEALECAFEAIEAQPGTFTVRDIMRFAGYSTAVSVIAELRRRGLVERVSAAHAKPSVYRVRPAEASA